MGTEENRKSLELFYREVMEHGNLSYIDEVTTPQTVDHSLPPGYEPNPEGVKKFMTMWRDAFPDVTAEVTHSIAEGDLATCRVILRGTHKGELMGIPATNKSVEASVIDIVRFDADGKAAEHWGVVDTAEIMMQLGVMEAPPA